MIRRPLRLSFRTRLSLIITAVFVAAGAGLLAVQYAVVQQLFASAMQVTTLSCQAGGEHIVANSGSTLAAVTGCAVAGTAPLGPGEDWTVRATAPAVLQQSVFLSEEVGGGLLVWSIIMLVVFAAIAAAIAFWLARRSLDRIGEVTTAARDISERALHRRLDLPGPDDEIKELGDTFDGMLDRLQLAFAAQDRFVANASHELRTPLTVTRTALEIPLEQGRVPKSLQPNLRRALTATRQSERLITALLALARSRGRLDESEPVDLGAIAAGELEELAPAAAERRIAVHSDVEPAVAEGDALLLARAVRNLLDNAIRHGDERGSLWLRVSPDAGAVTVHVENTGAQLAPATVALLAEPFYRADATRTSAREGTGLGLAIVDSVATTHGGALMLEPREGGGLIATLRLPEAPTQSQV